MARGLLASCLWIAIACGPSLRQVQTSSERYEQCYGADYDPSVTLEQRRQCWRAWLDDRLQSDPPEKVRYAELRLSQLALDGSTKPLPDPTPEPVPTYDHEYPRHPPSVYPTMACTPLCNDRWAECNSHCVQRDKSCLAACEVGYRVCVEGCP